MWAETGRVIYPAIATCGCSDHCEAKVTCPHLSAGAVTALRLRTCIGSLSKALCWTIVANWEYPEHSRKEAFSLSQRFHCTAWHNEAKTFLCKGFLIYKGFNVDHLPINGDQEHNKLFTPVILKLAPLKMLKHDDMFAVRQPEYQGNSPPVAHLKRLFHKDDKSQCEDSRFIGKRHNQMVETFWKETATGSARL